MEEQKKKYPKGKNRCGGGGYWVREKWVGSFISEECSHALSLLRARYKTSNPYLLDDAIRLYVRQMTGGTVQQFLGLAASDNQRPCRVSGLKIQQIRDYLGKDNV